MLLKVKRFVDSGKFLSASSSFLLQNAVDNNLLLSVISTFRTNPGYYDSFVGHVCVDQNDEVVAAVARTPPYDLLIAKSHSRHGLRLLCDVVWPDRIPGIIGDRGSVGVFADQMCRTTGCSLIFRESLRNYSADTIRPTHITDGVIREATIKDKDTIIRWLETWYSVSGNAPTKNPTTSADRSFNRTMTDSVAKIWVLEKDEIVSMAGSMGEVADGIRIGPVFTPAEHRGHGYAKTLIAEVGKLRLSQGYKRLFLFVDANNTIANKIYMDMGYRPSGVMDRYEIIF